MLRYLNCIFLSILVIVTCSVVAEEMEVAVEGKGSCACNIPRSSVSSSEGESSTALLPTSEPAHKSNPSQRRLSNRSSKVKSDMVLIPGRVFDMGTNSPGMPFDGESPRRKVSVPSFLIDKYEVSNAKFEEFVRDTGHVTDSEKWKWSFVLFSTLSKELQKQTTQWVQDAPWWTQVQGSYWRAPEGPGSDVFSASGQFGDRSNHPAVHISWTDAVAYCTWREGSRLPTEAEWELASRGSAERKVFPWGNVLSPNGTHRANIYEGEFPRENSKEDGYAYTAPVDAYGPQNDFGVYNMVGNVWEWVADWWTIEHDLGTGSVIENPRGPDEGKEKVKKGGSFICHKKFCYRYRNAARFKVEVDSGTQNSGFRCAKNIDP